MHLRKGRKMKKLSAAAAVLFVVAVETVARSEDLKAENCFDELAHDFGNVTRGTELNHRFKVTNTYKFPLNITQVRVSMAPVDASATQTRLQPGETAYVRVRMDTKRFVGPRTVSFWV